MPDHVAQPTEGQTAEEDGHIRPGGLVLTIVVSLVVFVGIGVLFYSLTYKSPSGTEVAQSAGTAVVNGRVVPHVTLRFQTYPDASGFVNGVAVHPGGNSAWPAYGLTNVFQVPAHSLVTVYARQYDSGGSLNNPWFATVRGTVGGTAVVNGKRVSSIDPNNVGHTFTVRGIPGYRSRVLPQRSRCRRSGAITRPITGSTSTWCSVSSRAARAPTPGTASSRAERWWPASAGPWAPTATCRGSSMSFEQVRGASDSKRTWTSRS